jgi:hypothetical protein
VLYVRSGQPYGRYRALVQYSECTPYARSKLLTYFNSISPATPRLLQVICFSNFRDACKILARQHRSCENIDVRDCEVFPMTGTAVTLVSSVAVVAFSAETCCLGLVLQ